MKANPNFHKFPKLGNFFIENGKFHIKKCKNFISSIGSFRKLFLLILSTYLNLEDALKPVLILYNQIHFF